MIDTHVLSQPSSITISVRRSGTRLTASTTLTYSDSVITGQAHRDDDNRIRAIAQATVEAIRTQLPCPAEIESAQVLAIPGRRVALTVVEFPDARGSYEAFVGSALVQGEVEEALARSVLAALAGHIDYEEPV